MSINPRSPLGRFMAWLTVLTYRGRRRNTLPHIPRHVRKVIIVPPAPLPLTERPYEAPLPVHDQPAPSNYGPSAWPQVLVDLFDGPVEGGYVGIGGKQVAA